MVILKFSSIQLNKIVSISQYYKECYVYFIWGIRPFDRTRKIWIDGVKDDPEKIRALHDWRLRVALKGK